MGQNINSYLFEEVKIIVPIVKQSFVASVVNVIYTIFFEMHNSVFMKQTAVSNRMLRNFYFYPKSGLKPLLGWLCEQRLKAACRIVKWLRERKF